MMIRPFLKRAMRRLATAFALLITGYWAAGLIGGAIPAHAGWRPPAQRITIYVETNGVHTDLVLPRRAAGVDLTRLVKPAHFGDPRYAGFAHIAFVWGERHFSLEMRSDERREWKEWLSTCKSRRTHLLYQKKIK